MVSAVTPYEKMMKLPSKKRHQQFLNPKIVIRETLQLDFSDIKGMLIRYSSSACDKTNDPHQLPSKNAFVNIRSIIH